MYIAVGVYDQAKAGHPEHYFAERYTFIDYRGGLKISPLSHWGYGNTIITAAHNVLRGNFEGAMMLKNVIVDDYAWVTSRCILYNCHIGHHAILSIGSVVTGMVVEPYTVVAGNPAVVIRRWNGKIWERA